MPYRILPFISNDGAKGSDFFKKDFANFLLSAGRPSMPDN